MSGFDESEQEHRSLKKPDPSLDGLADFLATNWGISADMDTLKKIDSYDDANYFFQTAAATGDKRSFLLKFYNAVETECPDILHGLGFMLQRINQQIAIPLQVPSIVQPLSAVCVQNFVMMQCRTASGGVELVAVRVFVWIEGTTLSRVQPDLRLMSELGTGIAEVWRALDGFAHPSFSRQHLWDLRQLALSKPLLCYVDCPQVCACIEAVHAQFREEVLPVSEQLPWSIIMADCNDANVIVTDDGSGLVGLIDFSDAVLTWSVNEIAIAMAYALLTSYGKTSPYKALGALLAGYTRVRALSPLELHCLPLLILARLSISVSVGACAISKSPDDDYLKLHAVPGRQAILMLSAVPLQTHRRFFCRVQECFRGDGVLIEDCLFDALIDDCYGAQAQAQNQVN